MRPLKYICALLFVKDIETSKQFYQEILGQKVKDDYGQCVIFHGDFSIMDGNYLTSIIHEKEHDGTPFGKNNCELYFETDDIAGLDEALREKGVEFVHPIREQPWGQRVLRVWILRY